jgi:hypothetical protein
MAAKKRTVQGKPIPVHLEHAIPHRLTDEGIEEANRTGNKGGPRVEVRDRFDRQIQAREAAAEGHLEPWESPDPMQEAIARVADNPHQDMAYRTVSEVVVQRLGMRGWDPCHDEKGKEIRVGDSTLCRMPAAKAAQRNAHYQEQGNQELREAQEVLEERTEKTIRDGQVVGVAPLRPGTIVRSVTDREHAATIGLHSHRGNSAEE